MRFRACELDQHVCFDAHSSLTVNDVHAVLALTVCTLCAENGFEVHFTALTTFCTFLFIERLLDDVMPGAEYEYGRY